MRLNTTCCRFMSFSGLLSPGKTQRTAREVLGGAKGPSGQVLEALRADVHRGKCCFSSCHDVDAVITFCSTNMGCRSKHCPMTANTAHHIHQHVWFAHSSSCLYQRAAIVNGAREPAGVSAPAPGDPDASIKGENECGPLRPCDHYFIESGCVTGVARGGMRSRGSGGMMP